QAAMAADDAVAPGRGDRGVLDPGGRRGEDELVDGVRSAVEDGEASSPDLHDQPAWERGHPGPRGEIDLAVGVRVPGGGEPVALGPFRKAAPAIPGAGGERFLAIAHDDVNACAA